MMYMPDALRASIELMEANPDRLIHRNSFNIASMSFEPNEIITEVKRLVPELEVDFQIDELRQSIADSWPNSMDDSCARSEWDWKPEYDLRAMSEDMIATLRKKFGK